MNLALTVFIVFLILAINERWARRQGKHNELSRKFVHLVVGSFVATWPFYLRWREIGLLSLAFLVVVTLSKALNIFHAIHTVQRPTWGEAFFALAVGLVALISRDQWIYAAALLQMSLADGLAAVIGTRFGLRSRYSIFGATKTVLGTLTFFIVSLLVLITYGHFSGHPLDPAWMLVVSGLASLVENVGIKGSDNLLVPLLVALFLAYS